MSDVSEGPIELHLRELGAACAAMGSRFSGALLEAAAQDYCERGPLRRFFDADPRRRDASRIGLRLMGALQYRAFAGTASGLAAHYPSCGGDGDVAALWLEARKLIDEDPESFARSYARTPQTNETARAMPLLAGLLAIVDAVRLPVVLLDVGTSAGLNLRLDRFRYEGDEWAWGDPDSPLVLRNVALSGWPAHLDVRPQIVVRAGCDLHPLDVADESDRLHLRSYVWADQTERFRRLDAAIAIARDVPAALESADMFEWIPRSVRARDGAVTVVMHSVVTEHLAPAARARMYGAIEEACAAATPAAPMAWLRLEPDDEMRYGTRVTIWPERDERAIARSDGHAQFLEWTGA